MIHHTFTHFHLEVEVVTSMFPMEQVAAKNSWWSAMDDIPDEALPTVMNKMLEAALPGVTKPKA